MTKTKKQQGFAHMMAMVVILVLALIGALGYIFWQNFMQPKTQISNVSTSTPTTDTSNTTTTPTANTTTPTTTTTTTPSTPVSTKGYLVLSDWGVKFKLPSNLATTINWYAGTPTKAPGYLFTTSEVEALGGNCSYHSNAYWVPLGGLTRSTTNNNVQDRDTQGYQGQYVTKIDNYYYFYSNPTINGSGNCSATNTQLQIQDQGIIENLLMSVVKN